MKKQNNGLVRNPFLYLLIIFLPSDRIYYLSLEILLDKAKKINYTELVRNYSELM